MIRKKLGRPSIMRVFSPAQIINPNYNPIMPVIDKSKSSKKRFSRNNVGHTNRGSGRPENSSYIRLDAQ